MSSTERVLCVVAHPDDETLGCGGTLAKHIQSGDIVMVVTLADGVSSRGIPGTDIERRREHLAALKVLGITQNAFWNFPDNQFDTVPLLAIVKDIEHAIKTFQPTVVYTHHRGDLNVDHQRTHEAVRVACRPQPDCGVKKLLYFEMPCSTTWGGEFKPNYFVDISNTRALKVIAWSRYVSEYREYPHPRSLDGVEGLYKWRGKSIGIDAAEAFEIGRIVA